MEERKIVVLNFCDGGVDIITTTDEMIEEYGDDVEEYLINHCGYNPNNIQWMSNPSYISEMSHDDYEDDEEALEYKLKERFKEIFTTTLLLSGDFDDHIIDCRNPIELALKVTIEDLCSEGIISCQEVGGVGYKFLITYDCGVFNVEWGKPGEWDWHQIRNKEINIGFDDESAQHPECDEILINGDDDDRMSANFYDGFAVEMGDFADDLRVMFYPTRKMVLASTTMQEKIIKSTGRDDYTPFDIALRYGSQPYKMSELF